MLGGLFVDDKFEEIFRQYNFKIHNIYRARGAHILETNQGLKLFQSFEGSRNHIEFENIVKEHLYANGYKNIDRYVINCEENIISEDAQGNCYIIKNWFEGENCNLKDINDVLLATGNLADIHNLLQSIRIDNSLIDKYKENNLLDLIQKHNREMKRVRSYIRDKRQKNEFETCFLGCYDYFYDEALKAEELLKKSDYRDVLEQSVYCNYVCHGSYNYHNVIVKKNVIATTNFDKSYIGIQIGDLYQFIRKVMEKNNWDISFGDLIIQEYNKKKPYTDSDKNILYILLMYPEKFWKITNFYYNSKKSWVPQRNIQKLISIQEQSRQKEEFIKRLLQ